MVRFGTAPLDPACVSTANRILTRWAVLLCRVVRRTVTVLCHFIPRVKNISPEQTGRISRTFYSVFQDPIVTKVSIIMKGKQMQINVFVTNKSS